MKIMFASALRATHVRPWIVPGGVYEIDQERYRTGNVELMPNNIAFISHRDEAPWIFGARHIALIPEDGETLLDNEKPKYRAFVWYRGRIYIRVGKKSYAKARLKKWDGSILKADWNLVRLARYPYDLEAMQEYARKSCLNNQISVYHEEGRYSAVDSTYGVCSMCDSSLLDNMGVFVGACNGEVAICTECMHCEHTCEHCHSVISTIANLVTQNGRHYCKACSQKSQRCNLCNKIFFQSDDSLQFGSREAYCDECTEGMLTRRRKAPSRRLSATSNTYTVSKLNIKRLVGLESEVVMDPHTDIPNRIRDYWSIVRDTSITPQGLEFVSPPIAGDAVLDALEILSENITPVCTLNDSCGFHVHVDAADLSSSDVAHFLKLFLALQNHIYSIVQNTRSRLHHSKKLPMVNFNPDSVSSNTQLAKLWYHDIADQRITFGKYNESRYRGLNLHSLYVHGTIEFRMHEGSLDPDDCSRFSELCHHLVNAGKILSRKKRGFRALKRLLKDPSFDMFAEIISAGEYSLESYLHNRKHLFNQ